MHQDGDTLDFVDARYGRRNDSAFGSWKKRWLLLDRTGPLCVGFGEE